MQEYLTVTIKNWSKYNPRKDIKHHRWFAMSNRVLEDADFMDFTGDEIKVWIYILSQASQQNSARICIKFKHSEKVCGIKKLLLLKTVEKLTEIGMLQNARTDSEHACSDHVRYKQTVQTEHTQHTTDTPAYADREHVLKSIWNEKKGALPIVKSLQDPKRFKNTELRWAENPSEDYWREVISKLAASKFCTGQSGSGWRASFDFLIKPGIHIKIMEGQYDNVSNTKKKNNGMDLSL